MISDNHRSADDTDVDPTPGTFRRTPGLSRMDEIRRTENSHDAADRGLDPTDGQECVRDIRFEPATRVIRREGYSFATTA